MAVLALALAASVVSACAQTGEAALRARAKAGLDLLMNAKVDEAIAVFREIQKADPQSPLGETLEASALWWKIYYATGNLTDPDVFIAQNKSATPDDAPFEKLIDSALAKAEARIQAGQDVARSHLNAGIAWGLRGRLAALRDKRLATAKAGKRMRAEMLEALRLDPSLLDAYAGLGNYNYFVDTLSSIVKLLGFFIGLPSGSREEGLKQLETCADKCELARPEAKFYLAKNLSRPSERQYERSLQLFGELAREYPTNPLWTMMVASLHCRLGRAEACEAGYRAVLRQTRQRMNAADVSLHRAARAALLRRGIQIE
jgi:tetratricopeptide (TPR) repeat protein